MYRVFAVSGSEGNIGASQIVYSMAELFSAGKERVLVIDCSYQYARGYSGIEDVADDEDLLGIDSVGEKLPSAVLIKTRKYDVILGVRHRIDWSKEIGPEGETPQERIRRMKNKVLEVTDKNNYRDDLFSFICKNLDQYDRILIDAGSDPRDKLTRMALEFADKRIYIVRQNPKSVEKMRNMAEKVLIPLGLYRDFDTIIVNAERKHRLLYTVDQVKATLGRHVYTLPFVRNGMKAEYTSQTLADMDKKYRNALQTLIKNIL